MKSILTGIDFSAPSAAVLRHAVHMGKSLGTRVHAVHVLESGRIARWASAGSRTSPEALAEQARQRLEAFVSEHAPDSGVETEVRIGRSATELCDAVKEQSAGLLVIAANDLTKKRLGSVASSCVRCASSDVLVLRDWQVGDFRRMVVCIDFSPMSGRALELGIRLAGTTGAGLDIVHVLYPPEKDLWGETEESEAETEDDLVAEYRDRVRREAEAFLVPHAAALEKVDHKLVLLESVVPSVEINAYLKEAEADLAILGTRGHSKIGGMFLGTNAERLLHDVAVSVLAVRPEGVDE